MFWGEALCHTLIVPYVLQASCLEWDLEGQYLAVAEAGTAAIW